MKRLKTIGTTASSALLIAGAVFVFGIVRAPAAHAAECGITAGDVAQITAIENDPSLTSSDEAKQELLARKNLVGETIVCAQQEVQVFQKNLAAATVPSDVQSLQSQLLGDLNEAAGFYDSQMAQLNVVGIAGTKAIAQQVLSWRQSTFIPLSENVNNFILWAQNQDLFATAQTRMNQTQSAVAFLEAASPDPALQTAFNNAQASFNNAESQNAAAQAALVQNLSPDQSLALIKQSLASLSATYQNLFTVSNLINNIIPQ
jgi:hypothetical protein